MANLLIPITNIRPGEDFSYYNNSYTRATQDEIKKHPARGCWDDNEVVYAYSGTLPVVFQSHVKVVVGK